MLHLIGDIRASVGLGAETSSDSDDRPKANTVLKPSERVQTSSHFKEAEPNPARPEAS